MSELSVSYVVQGICKDWMWYLTSLLLSPFLSISLLLFPFFTSWKEISVFLLSLSVPQWFSSSPAFRFASGKHTHRHNTQEIGVYITYVFLLMLMIMILMRRKQWSHIYCCYSFTLTFIFSLCILYTIPCSVCEPLRRKGDDDGDTMPVVQVLLMMTLKFHLVSCEVN